MTRSELHAKIFENNKKEVEAFVFSSLIYENMAIKDAKEHAALLAEWRMRLAIDYHQSMSAKEAEEAKEPS